MTRWYANLLTTGNLISGIIAILMAFDGHLITAGLLIFCATIFDAFDGKVARYFGSSSSFGLQYDSMADMISFGVAPALIVYAFAFRDLGVPGLLVTLVPVVAAAIRLARFNIDADGKAHDFIGLSSPLHACLMAALVLMCVARWDDAANSNVIAAIVIISSLLMISHVPLAGLPRFTLREQGINLVKLSALFLCVVYFALDPLRNAFPAIVVLIVAGFAAGIVNARRAAEEEELEDEEESVTIL
ncbi:CDP-diacylglycerol--serine O-phosphatidyltransferase [bacterium]|nr:CDP-diacylglycerol--serine O-phosphatidyltransferase [bacterium]RQV99382.1 MAG: CDP-diacylglycerol--serine O-phosphatidyltransferase [bacterium]